MVNQLPVTSGFLTVRDRQNSTFLIIFNIQIEKSVLGKIQSLKMECMILKLFIRPT